MAGPLRYMGGGHFKNKYVTGGMYGPNVIPGAMIPGAASTVYEETTAPLQQNINRQVSDLNSRAWQEDFMKDQAAGQALGSTALSAGTSALTTALPKLINMSPKDLTYSQNVTRGWMKGARGDYDTLARAGAPKTTMGRTLENPGFGTGVGTAMDVAGQIGQQAWSDDDPTTFTGKEKFGRMGSAAGKGMKMGAQLGSIIPGVGTAIGAAAGTTIGAWSGLLKGKKEQREAQEELAKRNRSKLNLLNRNAMLRSQEKEYSGYDFGTMRGGGMRKMYRHGGPHYPNEGKTEYTPLSQRVPSDVHPFNVPRYMREQAYPQGLPHPHTPDSSHAIYTPQTQMDPWQQRRAEYIPQTQRGNGGRRYNHGGPHDDQAAMDTVNVYMRDKIRDQIGGKRLLKHFPRQDDMMFSSAVRLNQAFGTGEEITKDAYDRNRKKLGLYDSDDFMRYFDVKASDAPWFVPQWLLDKYDIKAMGGRRKYDDGGSRMGVTQATAGEIVEPHPHEFPPYTPQTTMHPLFHNAMQTPPQTTNPVPEIWPQVAQDLYYQNRPEITINRKGGLRRKYDGGGIVSGIDPKYAGYNTETEGDSGMDWDNLSDEEKAQLGLDVGGMFYPPSAWASSGIDFKNMFKSLGQGEWGDAAYYGGMGSLGVLPWLGAWAKSAIKGGKTLKTITNAAPVAKPLVKVVKPIAKTDKHLYNLTDADDVIPTNIVDMVDDTGFAYEREDYPVKDDFTKPNPNEYGTKEYWDWQKRKRQNTLYGK
mgnify:CR=1 FL=1